MRAAFVGKGGSGKTTISSLFSRFLASQQQPVLAIDADINQHMAIALGLSAADTAAIAPMGNEIKALKSYFSAENPLISDIEKMVKTTPPGRGSALIRLQEDNPLYQKFCHDINGVRFMLTGGFEEQDMGVKCFHSKTGAVELFLNHLLDGAGEYAVVDMTAGSDAFASGLFTRFDVTFMVVEPTVASVGVYRQYKDYAADYDVNIAVIANKVTDDEDIAFIERETGQKPLTAFPVSAYVKSMARGEIKPFGEVEPEIIACLEKMKGYLDRQQRDWEKYYKQMIFFHQRNAEEWANAQMGIDLTTQIDPEFSLIAQI